MNWQFEGSNDKVNWMILDRRIYLSDNENYNNEVKDEQKSLQKPGNTSTWGIDQSIYNSNNGQQQGFRYFRVVQCGKNSAGTDNLTNSGLEIYGIAVHPEAWIF